MLICYYYNIINLCIYILTNILIEIFRKFTKLKNVNIILLHINITQLIII